MFAESTIKDHSYIDKEFSNINDKYLDLEVAILDDSIKFRLEDIKKEAKVVNTASIFQNSIPFFFPQLKNSNFDTKDYICGSQNWVCYVLNIQEDTFSAKLYDKSDPSTYEVAEFEIKEVPRGDRNLIREGAIFYWSVGYANNKSGQIIKLSLIRFRRSINWSSNEMEDILLEADRLNDNISWV